MRVQKGAGTEGRSKVKRSRSKGAHKPTSRRIGIGDFWREFTGEELAKEQGVGPFDFSEAGSNWPPGADFDEFMEAINSGRASGYRRL